MKYLRWTVLFLYTLGVFLGAVLLLPTASISAQGVPASGGGGGVVPSAPTATPGLSPADATATALAGSLPLIGAAAQTATALALAQTGDVPPSGSGTITIPITGHATDTTGYIVLTILAAVVLVVLGLWIKRRRTYGAR
jgi:hypothetical protein